LPSTTGVQTCALPIYRDAAAEDDITTARRGVQTEARTARCGLLGQLVRGRAVRERRIRLVGGQRRAGHLSAIHSGERFEIPAGIDDRDGNEDL